MTEREVSFILHFAFQKETSGNLLHGSLAQLGEHLPYKQRVTGSSPVVSTKDGAVVQLVRTPACHAGGRGFEPLLRRHLTGSSEPVNVCPDSSVGRAGD